MKLTEITFPRYNLDKLPPDAMNSRKIEYYSLSGIPEDYVSHAPDFGHTADTLRDCLRAAYPNRELCIRGVSLAEHNRVNRSNKSIDELIATVERLGHDRFDPSISGQGYANEQNRKIDIFAYDVYPNVDDEDLIYFFMSFYYFGLASSGEPSLLDLIIVYDRTRLSVVEHTYPGRDDIKRDGFTFKSDPRDAILEILKIKR